MESDTGPKLVSPGLSVSRGASLFCGLLMLVHVLRWLSVPWAVECTLWTDLRWLPAAAVRPFAGLSGLLLLLYGLRGNLPGVLRLATQTSALANILLILISFAAADSSPGDSWWLRPEITFLPPLVVALAGMPRYHLSNTTFQSWFVIGITCVTCAVAQAATLSRLVVVYPTDEATAADYITLQVSLRSVSAGNAPLFYMGPLRMKGLVTEPALEFSDEGLTGEEFCRVVAGGLAESSQPVCILTNDDSAAVVRAALAISGIPASVRTWPVASAEHPPSPQKTGALLRAIWWTSWTRF